MYIVNLYRELLTWKRVRNVVFENQKALIEKNFRVDWIGRIYTVINLPEEVATHNPQVQQAWILGQFKDFDNIFLEMGIADYISPEFMPIKDTTSYLLILSPDREYLRLWPFLFFALKATGFIILGRILYKVLMTYGTQISTMWNSLIEFLF